MPRGPWNLCPDTASESMSYVVEVERQLAVGLHQVDVDVGIGCGPARQLDQLFELAERAELVVAVHQGHDTDVFAQRVEQRFRSDVPVFRGVQLGDVVSVASQQAAALQQCGWSALLIRTRPDGLVAAAPTMPR